MCHVLLDGNLVNSPVEPSGSSESSGRLQSSRRTEQYNQSLLGERTSRVLGRGGWLAGLTLAKDGFPEEVTSQLSPEGCWVSQVTVLQRGTVFVQSWSPGDKFRGWCRAHWGGKGRRMALSGCVGTDYETRESGLGVLEGFFPSEKVKNDLEGDTGGAGRPVGLMSGARWDAVA